MIGPLAFALAAVSAVTAGVLVLTAPARRRPDAVPALVAVETGLVVQAVVDAARWLAGDGPGQPAVHAAYVATSLLPLPLAGLETRGADGVWARALLALAFAVVAVLVVRMQTTWR